ncbi:hypothetical protein J7E62_07820, partial [Variovorax paradoxus]|nr:hypothetical protein [Variovorax paradoxus]
AGHGPHARTLLTHACHRHPVLGLKLPVPCSFIHVHTLGDQVLHFRVEAALENHRRQRRANGLR